jgi:perosamine synthetase
MKPSNGKQIPFFRPVIDESTITAVSEVLRSGWLTTGAQSAKFESAFAQYVSAEHAVFVNSCTAALHLCLASIDIKRGDEIIVPTYTFAASAEVVEYFDAKPVFVDIRPDTMNIDETKIEEKITKKTKAIIPVHFAGQPCEMNAILEIARRKNLYLIEDAAHCTPAYYHGLPVGTIGDATCFSFYANQCITTGEGGMVTTNNSELADRCRILRLHGLSRDAVSRYGQKGSWRYDIIARGLKYNPTDISAVIGLGQLAKAEEYFSERKRVVSHYQKCLSTSDKIELITNLPGNQSSCHIFPIRLKGVAASRRDQIIELLRDNGIGTSVHFIPLHMHSYYRDKYNYEPADFPVAFDAYSRVITLPVYPTLTDEEVEYISKTLLKIIA